MRAGGHRFRLGEHDRAGKDRDRAQEMAIDILPKHNPGDRHGGEALSIEQEGSSRETSLPEFVGVSRQGLRAMATRDKYTCLGAGQTPR